MLHFSFSKQLRAVTFLDSWNGKYVCRLLVVVTDCYPQQLSFPQEKFLRKASKAKVLSRFQCATCMLVLQSQG